MTKKILWPPHHMTSATHSTLPLFQAYPNLADLLSPQSFADIPTKTQALTELGENTWIKRDDLTHKEYGGNKIRKLDFVLSDIRRKQKKHVITFGATGTNAGVATAIMCHRNNLKCTIYLFDQPVTDTVKKNLELMRRYGAELIYKGSLLKTVLSYYLSPYRLHQDSYFLWAGCSNDVATFAYVNAAYELKQQIDNGDLPEPENIFVPVGSCSTLAGLTLGVKMAGLNTKVIGIRVAPAYLGPFPACTAGEVNKVIGKAYSWLKQNSVPLKFDKPACLFSDDYFGEGYGCATEQSQQAINQFSQAGIELENTYSAKAAAAFLEQAATSNKPQLFWNTFNSRDTLANAPMSERELPQKVKLAIKAS